MKFKKISLLSLLLICGLLVTACDGESNSGGTDNPDTPTVVEPPSGDDPDDTKTDDTEPGIQEPDTGDDGGDDGDGGDNNPDNPDDDPDPDTGGGGDGGDTGGTSDPTKTYPVYQAYSYVTTSGQIKKAGGTVSSNGLTWTTTAATNINYNSAYGVQIGAGSTSSSGPQYDPWIISTDFGENVKLASVTVYLYNANNAEATAHYEITFSESSITSGDFTNNYDSVFLAQATDINIVGSTLSISLNAVTGYAFYLRGISLSLYTTTDSELSLSVDKGYEPPDYPDNPNDDPDPDTGGGDGGDNPDIEPGPEEGGDGGDDNPDYPDNPNDDPDPDTGDDEYTIYQAYSHAFTKDADVGTNTTGTGTTTQNGLTWTYVTPDGVTLSKASNDTKGIQIGTASAHPTADNPFVISTTFGETVMLKSVDVYTFTNSGSSNDGYCTVTLDGEEVISSSYTNAHSDPYQTTKTDMTLKGNNLSISIYSTTSTAYLKAISLSIYTTESTSLSLSVEDDYRPTDCPDDYTPPTINPNPDTGTEPGPEEGGSGTGDLESPEHMSDYPNYMTYALKFQGGDLNTAGGTCDRNGLKWTYDAMTYYLGVDGTYNRGAGIGSSTNPQYEPWTFTTDFGGEEVVISDITLYLYTTTDTSATAEYKIIINDVTYDDQTFSQPDYNADPFEPEYTELDYVCNTLTISLNAVSQHTFYFKGISLSLWAKEDSQLDLSEDEIVDPDYEPAPVEPGVNGVKETAYLISNYDPDVYYEGLDDTKTGEELRSELQEICEPQTRYTYGDIRYMLLYTDEDPREGYEGYMYGAYDGDKLPAYWDTSKYDREHVWACSHMRLNTDDPENDYRPDNSSVGHYSDIHNLRVCCKPVNTSKNDKYFGNTTDTNNFYANVTNPESIGSGKHSFDGSRYDSATGEFDQRGDTARICLYQYMMYGELNLADDLEGEESNYTTFGQLSVLLEWNTIDPVDDFEKQRNDRCYEYQGNRNPFIDYPDLANQLFN